MKKQLARFTSRKFLLALGAFITFIANEQYTEAVIAITSFIAAEGAIDTLSPRQSIQVTDETIESYNDVDTSKIVSGAGRVKTFDEE